MKRRSLGQRKQSFMHPATGKQWLIGIADDDVVAPYRGTFANIDERDLMALGHVFAKLEPTRKSRSAGEAKIVDDDRDIVGPVHPDIAWHVCRHVSSSQLTVLRLASRHAACANWSTHA